MGSMPLHVCGERSRRLMSAGPALVPTPRVNLWRYQEVLAPSRKRRLFALYPDVVVARQVATAPRERRKTRSSKHFTVYDLPRISRPPNLL